MPRESKKLKQERGIETCRRLHTLYPHVESALEYHNAYTLLVAVMLSAQTTDAAVNKVTPELFRRWPNPEAMASARSDEVGECIRTIGFGAQRLPTAPRWHKYLWLIMAEKFLRPWRSW